MSEYVGVHPDRFLLRRWAVVQRFDNGHFILFGAWTRRGADRIVKRHSRRRVKRDRWTAESGLPVVGWHFDVLDMRDHPAR